MGIVNKMLNLIGFESQDEYEDDLIENSEFSSSTLLEDDDLESFEGGKRNKVVKIHTTAQLKLVVMQPENFEDARDIANHLKSKKPVVMNLESVDRDVARRIVDFLSGAVFALDGNIQKTDTGEGQNGECLLVRIFAKFLEPKFHISLIHDGHLL